MDTRITGCIGVALAALAGTAGANTVGTISLSATEQEPASIAHPAILEQHAIA